MKSYTNIEQSEKLTGILPLETADMCYWVNDTLSYNDFPLVLSWHECTAKERYLPCWSLASLLNYMREIDYFPDILADEHSVEMSVIYYDDEEGNTLHPLHKISVEEETFVDAVVNLIVKLKEKDLL